MVKSKDCVLIARKGVVEVEVKDGIIVAYPKTQEAVREIIMEYVKALERAKYKLTKPFWWAVMAGAARIRMDGMILMSSSFPRVLRT